jgi:hypothetical protein
MERVLTCVMQSLAMLEAEMQGHHPAETSLGYFLFWSNPSLLRNPMCVLKYVFNCERISCSHIIERLLYLIIILVQYSVYSIAHNFHTHSLRFCCLSFLRNGSDKVIKFNLENILLLSHYIVNSGCCCSLLPCMF